MSNLLIKLLILEDEPALCGLVEFISQDLGVEVFTASNFSEAKEILLLNKDINIGLFDYHLPDVHGFEEWKNNLFETVSHLNGFKYIFVTGDFELTNELAKNLGATGVLHKPVTSEEIQTVLLNMMDKVKKNTKAS